ncbi:uncharacterized protein LOC113341059 isoform X2 [Papaver somniferum]|uniref:uncharacterized protein LOC113341059 isoform X2 n=1 Tax=Papaver somniferum TaxID=3469 RepID=UPI000E6F74C9|nr:uncharacterized protein LOC113341059 isoform X2 [Papaver somniferum]
MRNLITAGLDQRKNACNQTQSNGEGEKKDSRLNATTSSKGKMLLEYWIVIVQGFKQRATGNMDDPYLIPGLARKLVRRPFLRRVVFPVKLRKACGSILILSKI